MQRVGERWMREKENLGVVPLDAGTRTAPLLIGSQGKGHRAFISRKRSSLIGLRGSPHRAALKSCQ